MTRIEPEQPPKMFKNLDKVILLGQKLNPQPIKLNEIRKKLSFEPVSPNNGQKSDKNPPIWVEIEPVNAKNS